MDETAHTVVKEHDPKPLDPDEPGHPGQNRTPTVLHAPRDSYEQPIRKWKEDPLLWLLRRVERMPRPEPVSNSIAMEPTGRSRRLGL